MMHRYQWKLRIATVIAALILIGSGYFTCWGAPPWNLFNYVTAVLLAYNLGHLHSSVHLARWLERNHD